MKPLRAFFICALTIVGCVAQPTRLELLSRFDAHARRPGASALSGAPELSRDGNFIFFLSEAPNLATNVPVAKNPLNLYMTDRRTGETTLLSTGLNGEPANDSVVNFEISSNNRRVLIETAASNLIANDTNNATDVFIRDLDLGQTILVSANLAGAVTRNGAIAASMSGDGNMVAFTSRDTSFVSNPALGTMEVFVRNVATATTERLKAPAGYTNQYARSPVISDDGTKVAFSADVSLPDTIIPTFKMNVLYDLINHTSVAMGQISTQFGAGAISDPIMTTDGSFVTFGLQQNAFGTSTNVLVRYSTELDERQTIISNQSPSSIASTAISSDASTILYFQDRVFSIARTNGETRTFPHTADGAPILLPMTFGIASMSADGNFVTFSTDLPLLDTDGTAIEYRTYLYDVEADQLMRAPIASPRSGPSDPVLNADGSVIIFSSADEGIVDEFESAAQNIYAWDRVGGGVQLVSKSHSTAFENSDRSDTKLSETRAISEDGTKVVFASRAAATDVVDTNGTWDIFVLDRTTGRKELVSVSMGGASTGSHPSIRPAISGDGRVVAFFSRATNLVSVPTFGTEQLYVRELDRGITHLVADKDGGPANDRHVHESLSFSYDGNRLAFSSRATDLDPRLGGMAQIYLYDLSSNKVGLVSYNVSGTGASFGEMTGPTISRDGAKVAFRCWTRGGDFGLPPYTSVAVRTIDTGEIAGAPALSSSLTPPGSFPQTVEFNRASTLLFYGIPNSYLASWDLVSPTYTIIATNCVQASVSDDGRWVAIARTEVKFPVKNQVLLRDTTTGIETVLSSNVVSGGAGNLNSYRPKITSDGRFVVFESRATNLTAGDVNGTVDLFMYDRDRKRLDLVSASFKGGAGNAASLCPIISPDNSFVAFTSYASDLFPHDYNEGADIFAAYFPAPDSDADGVDDRWEIAKFGSLTQDLSGDSDGDGLSDAAEFQAGTDPKLSSSNLRLISASVDAGKNVVLCWAATPGRAYRIQARARFNANNPWQDLTDPVAASRSEEAFTLPATTNASELYFRIVTAD